MIPAYKDLLPFDPNDLTGVLSLLADSPQTMQPAMKKLGTSMLKKAFREMMKTSTGENGLGVHKDLVNGLAMAYLKNVPAETQIEIMSLVMNLMMDNGEEDV